MPDLSPPDDSGNQSTGIYDDLVEALIAGAESHSGLGSYRCYLTEPDDTVWGVRCLWLHPSPVEFVGPSAQDGMVGAPHIPSWDVGPALGLFERVVTVAWGKNNGEDEPESLMIDGTYKGEQLMVFVHRVPDPDDDGADEVIMGPNGIEGVRERGP
jgi:hypothetical protein